MPFFFKRKDTQAILYHVHGVTHTRAPHLPSSTVSALGTGFVEDDFSTNQGEGDGRITFIVFFISLIVTL